MENTILIKVTNHKALRLLHELEELQLIKVVEENIPKKGKKLSDKYRGILNKEQGKDLKKHIQQMRNEWSNT